MKTNRFLSGVALMIVLAYALGALPASATEFVNISTSSGMDSVKVKWDVPAHVSCFKLYRKDISDTVGSGKEDYAFKGYACIAKLSRSTSSYRDTDVEFGHTYAYVVKGYKKRDGKLKLACTSYMPDAVEYASAGVIAPELLNAGTGEFFENTGRRIYLYVQSTTGVELQGADVYRKAKGEKRYVRVKVGYPERKQFDGAGMLLDSSVKPNMTYYYKARAWAKYKGKKYYSGYSNRVCAAAVNTVGKFKIKTLTRAGKVSKIRFKVTSKTGNAETRFLPALNSKYVVGSGAKEKVCTVKLARFSTDGKKWRAVGEKGVVLEAGEVLYLEYVPANAKSLQCAGAVKGAKLQPRARYKSGVRGVSLVTFNLARSTGRAFVDWDY